MIVNTCQAESSHQRPGQQCQFRAHRMPYKVGQFWVYLCGIHAYHNGVAAQHYKNRIGIEVELEGKKL